MSGGQECEFLQKVSADLNCPICHLVLNNPVQIEVCGHRFCRKCLDVVLEKRAPKCPIDRTPIKRKKVFADIACNRLILDLHVKCSITDCPWEGELRDLEKHQKHCPFEIVCCTNDVCEEMLPRRDLEKHMNVYCKWRPQRCPHCSKEFLCRDLEMHSHFKDDCPLAIIPCAYEYLGCKATFRRDHGERHKDSEVREHLDLACKRLKVVQEEITFLRQQANVLPYVWKIDNVSGFLREARAATSCVECDSPPIYTERQGYKFQLHAKFDRLACRSTADVWLRLYFRLLPGEYDTILEWPFFITNLQLAIIDQGAAEKRNIVRNKSIFHFMAPVKEAMKPCKFLKMVSSTKLESRAYIANDAVFVELDGTAAMGVEDLLQRAGWRSEEIDEDYSAESENDAENYSNDGEDEVVEDEEGSEEARNSDADGGMDDDDDDDLQIIEVNEPDSSTDREEETTEAEEERRGDESENSDDDEDSSAGPDYEPTTQFERSRSCRMQ